MYSLYIEGNIFSKREGVIEVRQFTVELDETICNWLVHVSEITGNSIEKVIADGIYNQIAILEENINKLFTYSE